MGHTGWGPEAQFIEGAAIIKLAISADGSRLAIAADGATSIELIDPETGNRKGQIGFLTFSKPKAMDFTFEKDQLVTDSGGGFNNLYIWDIVKGKRRTITSGFFPETRTDRRFIRNLAGFNLSQNKRYLAAIDVGHQGDGKYLKVIDLKTGLFIRSVKIESSLKGK